MTSEGTLTGTDSTRSTTRRSPRRSCDTTIFARVSPEQKAPHPQRAAARRLGRRVPRRRRQRRARAAPRRRRHLGRLRDRRRQGRRRHHPARKRSRRARRRRRGGRRIFANTIKYVLMGTSSNFGNMFSVTVAAAFLPFLPMLPSQILLNNLLYDASQMTIPTDNVDEEQLGAVALGHRVHPPVHGPLRADQLAVRLRDLRRHALGASTRPRRCSAPAGSSNRSRPRPWSSS